MQQSDSLNDVLNFDFQSSFQSRHHNRVPSRTSTRVQEINYTNQRKSSLKLRFGKLVADVKVSQKDE